MPRLLLAILFLACFASAQETVGVEVLEEGMGPGITRGQAAVVSYRLTLEDGTLIDASNPVKPYGFVVGDSKVVPGLSQGVSGMKVGERRVLRIPPSLAYGDKGTGPIPGGATLVFEVELLEIRKPDQEEEEAELKDKMLDDDFLAKRHARDLSKPAIFEYLIRDFFTKPWRYADGHLKLWKDNLKLFIIFVVLLIGYSAGRKRGYFIP